MAARRSIHTAGASHRPHDRRRRAEICGADAPSLALFCVDVTGREYARGMAVERFVKSEPVGAQRRTADRDIFEALVRPHARQRFPAAGASVLQGVWVWLST